jgi:UDP-N-acetylglucosamine--N-acetylmuramyl-(pentapeptide) pyrophosphoryl-undecaprenol N-acetylglucosamine transferase
MNTILFTGGHHNSAVPLAQKFKSLGYKIIFVGCQTTQKGNRELSSEYKEITALGFNFINFFSPKFYNNKNPLKYIQLLISFLRALGLMLTNHPIAVVSFGGYLAVPFCLCAKLLKIKIVTHEQTATVGLANKLISAVSDKVFLSWQLPVQNDTASKYLYTGLPLREEILKITPRKEYKQLKTIFITGGKQASHVFNQFVFNNIDTLLQNFTIIHQTAKNSKNNDYQISQEIMKKYGKERYWAFDYVFGEDYKSVLNRADFLFSRAGAHITYELCYLKIPTIFCPIPWVSENEQEENAKMAMGFFPCVILNEANLNLEEFNKSQKTLLEICKQKTAYKDIPINATEKIFAEIIKLLS